MNPDRHVPVLRRRPLLLAALSLPWARGVAARPLRVVASFSLLADMARELLPPEATV
ncbi:MAG: hypothetical protein JNM08_15525, partial [Rubrivivax sp.]|nr:hypothetical protein [Rubrivivax sp.]